ncbi:MAG: hypothetical protein WC365_04385 [Candidatus Babeliales bacterium]|jgi:hypothetical protein
MHVAQQFTKQFLFASLVGVFALCNVSISHAMQELSDEVDKQFSEFYADVNAGKYKNAHDRLVYQYNKLVLMQKILRETDAEKKQELEKFARELEETKYAPLREMRLKEAKEKYNIKDEDGIYCDYENCSKNPLLLNEKLESAIRKSCDGHEIIMSKYRKQLAVERVLVATEAEKKQELEQEALRLETTKYYNLRATRLLAALKKYDSEYAYLIN